MKKIRFSLALVLLFAMIVCATVPTFAETIANAADAKGASTASLSKWKR